MVSVPARQPYQCVGNASSHQCSPGISAQTSQKCGPFDVRECKCSVVQTGRQDQILLSDLLHNKSHQVLRSEKHFHYSSPHSEILQHTSQWSITSMKDAFDGMVDWPRSPGSNVQTMWNSIDQSFCNILEQETSTLSVSLPRSIGSLHQCHVDPMKWDRKCVCVRICLVHQVAHPFSGVMLSYLSSNISIVFPIFSATISGLPFHLVWSTLHILSDW